MSQAVKPCERCGGSGRMPRVQRRRSDGTPDPFDIVGRHREICDRCGGSGEAPADRPSDVDRGSGYAADLA
jgi:hypothetical protein